MADKTPDIKTYNIIFGTGSYYTWSKRFLSQAKLVGYNEILQGETTLPSIKKQSKTDKDIAILELTDQAYNDLINACENEMAFCCVDEATTNENPEGDCRLAWKNLTAKFQPTDGVTKMHLKQQFMNCKLNPKEDPEIWIKKLNEIRNQLKLNHKYTIDDEDFIFQIINSLPNIPQWEELIMSLERQLQSKNDPVTINSLTQILKIKYNHFARKYKIKNKGKTNKEPMKCEKSHDIAMYGNRQFKGTCTFCGIIGNSKEKCWKNPDFKGNIPEWYTNGDRDPKCTHCNAIGHVETNCYRKMKEDFEKNKDEFNEWKKSNKIKDKKPALGGFVLQCNEETDKDLKTAWIGDTGASHHMSNRKIGFINIKKFNEQVQMGNGSPVEVEFMGDIVGNLIDENNNSTIVTITNASYVPNLVCNL